MNGVRILGIGTCAAGMPDWSVARDVLRGERTLFTRSDEVDRLWQVVQPVLDDRPEVQPYAQGSWGPQAAVDLPEGGWRLGRDDA